MDNLRFDIYVESFKLTSYYNTNEKLGLKWCRDYMNEFQKTVLNCEMKVRVYEKPDNYSKNDPKNNKLVLRKTYIKKPVDK